VAPEAEAALSAHADTLGVAVTRIGRFIDGPPAVRVIGADGTPLALPRGGWSHFP
jgi:thiamine-monophosphate kinase